MTYTKWLGIGGIIGIGLLCAVIIWFVVSRFRVDGFQPTAPDAQMNVQDEVCNILKGLRSSIQYKYDNFDSTTLSKETKDVLGVSLTSLDAQIISQGCK